MPANIKKMKLVLDLDENQLHHLQSCLYAGRMEAWDYMDDYIKLDREGKAKIWERILYNRRALGDLITSAIEEQGCIGSFGEEG